MDTILQRIQSSRKNGNIDFVIEERHEHSVISRMPVRPGILNPFGTIQAGALVWLADVTASVLVLENHPPTKDGKGFPLAIDLHTALVGNQGDGEVTAEARFVRKGRKVVVVRTRIKGKKGLLAEVTTTHVAAG